jgi:hypothetical protein
MSIFNRFDDKSLFANLTHRTRDLTPASFPDKRKYVVSDRPVPEEVERKIGPLIRSLDDLSDAEVASSVFYVYFQCDSDALPILKRIKDVGGIFVPHLDFSKTEYRFIDRLAHDAMSKTWARAKRVSHLLPSVHENICEALALTAHLEGDYVEIGVYLGGSALTALNYMREAGHRNPSLPVRKAWLLDTYDGFSYSEARDSADTIWADTHRLYGRNETMAYVDETLSDTGVPYELVASNICADALPSGVGNIAVANVDVDMYEPTLAALSKVAGHMQKGGIILAEDPTCTPGLYGALIAIEEFLASQEGKCFYKIFKGGHYFLIRMT